uniref:Uncharacterized protein n=1 Tax=Cannabis sativa TaxID=3483 RepID=A0A803NY04_CANSA
MCRKTSLEDPHIVELMARGRVRVVEEAEQPTISQAKEPFAEKPKVSRDEETLAGCRGCYPPEDLDHIPAVKEVGKKKRSAPEREKARQESARPVQPPPASRHKGKVVASEDNSDDSSSEDERLPDNPPDDMASKMRDLVKRSLGGSSSSRTGESFDVTQNDLSLPFSDPPLANQPVVLDLPSRTTFPP